MLIIVTIRMKQFSLSIKVTIVSLSGRIKKMGLGSLVKGVKYIAGGFALGMGLLFGGSGCEKERDNVEPPKEFEAEAGHRTAYLSWKFPDNLEMPSIMVRRKIDDFPADSLDGTLVYEGNGQSHMDTNLTENTLYCYKAFFYSNTDPLTFVLIKTASATPFISVSADAIDPFGGTALKRIVSNGIA